MHPRVSWSLAADFWSGVGSAIPCVRWPLAPVQLRTIFWWFAVRFAGPQSHPGRTPTTPKTISVNNTQSISCSSQKPGTYFRLLPFLLFSVQSISKICLSFPNHPSPFFLFSLSRPKSTSPPSIEYIPATAPNGPLVYYLQDSQVQLSRIPVSSCHFLY